MGRAKTLVSALATVAVLVPVELAIRQLRPGRKPHLHKHFHKALTHAFGIQTIVHGAPAREGGVLFVSNHVSYLDIPVLGAQISAVFVAKSEVARWGFFGWIADVGRTVYVDREQRSRASEQRDEIVDRLASGADVILFPEGTNSDGVAVMPFKSALFAVAKGANAAEFLIQPVTIAYTRMNGMPLTRGFLPEIAWVGDTELVPHALTFMGLGKVRVEVQFHPAVRANEFASRKALALHCHSVVAAGYRRLMRGSFAPCAPKVVASPGQKSRSAFTTQAKPL